MPRQASWLLAMILAAASMAAVVTLGGSTSADAELARRLSDGGDPERFRFLHRAGGSKVLDCFQANRSLAGTVDYAAGLAVLRDESGDIVARKSERRVLLRTSLFAAGVSPATWLSVALPPTQDLRAALTRSLGTELAGYVLVPGLPPSGPATAAAALGAAAEVNRLGATKILGRRADRYRITVAEDAFAGATSAPTAEPNPAAKAVPAPRIEVWVDDRDQVVQVSVVAGSDGTEQERPGGWMITYQVPARPLPPMATVSSSDVTNLPVDRLQAPRREGCALPL